MAQHEAGHRALTHTADLRVEAWAPTRERCIAEALLATVEAFADVSAASPTEVRRRAVTGEDDEDLLVACLDELVYLLDTEGEVPVAAEVSPVADGVELRLDMVSVAGLEQVGAVPKAVSLHDLRFGRGPDGWFCSVVLDL
ncbi:MAG TPA: archease [Nocardioidaceae bacterium]|nr:archease [Nocardioidaceae bacterium]